MSGSSDQLFCLDDQGVSVMSVTENRTETLRTAEQNHVTPYCISSYQSNAMLSDNPHSGIYKADVARTLDLNGGSPACNQGGVMVVYEEKEDNNATD